MSSDALFYKNLEAVPSFNQVVEVHNYKPLPASWYVIITDIKNSTAAIQNGRYKEVNLLGVAPLIGILNETDSSLIPFIFGGDGVTLCVPGSLLPLVRNVLQNTLKIAVEAYGLELRAGIIPVQAIYNQSEEILVGKFKVSPFYEQASFFGGGLSLAEKWLKENHPKTEIIVPDFIKTVSYKGLECRWQPIKTSKDYTISVLVKALNPNRLEQIEVYKQYLEFFTTLFDELEIQPISTEFMHMNTSFNGLSAETKIRTFGQTTWQQLKYAFETKIRLWVGRYMMHKNITTESTAWGNYKSDLIANSDFRKFDETMRQVVTCSKDQLLQLENWLEDKFKQKKLVYGIHRSKEALITCMVFQYDKAHIHFVDGNNGGYTVAAQEMKKRLATLNQK
jgi:hypothetical protein